MIGPPAMPAQVGGREHRTFNIRLWATGRIARRSECRFTRYVFTTYKVLPGEAKGEAIECVFESPQLLEKNVVSMRRSCIIASNAGAQRRATGCAFVASISHGHHCGQSPL